MRDASAAASVSERAPFTVVSTATATAMLVIGTASTVTSTAGS
ncbi:hypothetical protein [Agromyces sp. SYSU T00266]